MKEHNYLLTNYGEIVEQFQHGWCNYLTEFILSKNKGLKPICILDNYYNDEYDEEMMVLVHCGCILENGKVIDSQFIYENAEEFINYVDSEFDVEDEHFLGNTQEIKYTFSTIHQDSGSFKDVVTESDFNANKINEFLNSINKIILNENNKIKNRVSKANIDTEIKRVFKTARVFKNSTDETIFILVNDKLKIIKKDKENKHLNFIKALKEKYPNLIILNANNIDKVKSMYVNNNITYLEFINILTIEINNRN